MNRYRKKPVVIEAIQFDGTNIYEIQSIIGTHCNVMHEAGTNNPVLSIWTLEGTLTVSLNDWIIKGVKGEFYPCKPDIFEATYEKAEVTA